MNRVGQKLAASSERPNLPWTFRVVDDPTVNAFALPGGKIYVTRGLLTHLTSEAELASVLGHEIGHVTGRHSVEQMSKAQLAQIGLIAGMIVKPELARQYGDIATQGLQLLFLKYGRDDERQADDLGLRYIDKENYDPREMPGVFETLRRVSAQQGAGGKVPGWLATHPSEEERIHTISSKVAQLESGGASFANRTVNREGYLKQIDNVTFGQNPREGYFVGNTFIQPELAIQMRFPQGWRTSNEKSAVGALSPNQDALIVVTLSDQNSPQAGVPAVLLPAGGPAGAGAPGGPGRSAGGGAGLRCPDAAGRLRGIVAFVENNNRVYQIMGYTSSQRWGTYDDVIADSVGTFERVTDRNALNVEPKRVDVVSIPNSMTLDEFARRYPSTVDMATLAIINQADQNTRFPAGAEVKRVVGGQLPTERGR